MKSLVWTVPTALLIFFFIHGNDSLQCYSCTAQKNSSDNCEVNASQSQSEMCPENSTLCISVLFNDTITRKCATDNSSCQETGNTDCFYCNQDLCNIDTFNSNSTNINATTITTPPNYSTNTSINVTMPMDNITTTVMVPTSNTTNITLSTTTAITPMNNTTTATTSTPTKGSATEVRSKVFPVIVFSIISILFKFV